MVGVEVVISLGGDPTDNAVSDNGSEQWPGIGESTAEVVAYTTTMMPITYSSAMWSPADLAISDNERELDILRWHHRPPLPAPGSSTGHEPSLLGRLVGLVRGSLYGD